MSPLNFQDNAVNQLLYDLNHDKQLQHSVSQSNPEDIVKIFDDRGVHVSRTLLTQFLVQLEAEESSDVELDLEQLEDVDGGLGVADVVISGAVLAVVASNAGGLMSQAQAATVSDDGPVATLMSDSTIAG